MRREMPPDGLRIPFDQTAIFSLYAQTFKRDTLGIQHSKNIMIRHDQEICRIGKSLVLSKPAGVGMAMRRQDRPILDAFIKTTGEAAAFCVNRKQTIRMQEGLLRR